MKTSHAYAESIENEVDIPLSFQNLCHRFYLVCLCGHGSVIIICLVFSVCQFSAISFDESDADFTLLLASQCARRDLEITI